MSKTRLTAITTVICILTVFTIAACDYLAVTPTVTPTNTSAPHWTETPIAQVTATPTHSPTPTDTATPTPAIGVTLPATQPAPPSPLPTWTPTPTDTPQPVPTDTPTHKPTKTPSETPQASPSATQTASATPTPAAPSRTPTSTPTPIVNQATNTPTMTPTPTASPSRTPTRTATPINTPTRTATAIATATPISGTPQPVGVPGNWTLAWSDEFNGNALDRNKWEPYWKSEGHPMNNVPTYSANVSIDSANGWLVLSLPSSTSGALVWSSSIDHVTPNGWSLAVGQYAEARINFPGSGTTIYNWPTWWAISYGSAFSEFDVAEGLGTLTVNYHNQTGAHNQGTVPGVWSNNFHVYGLWRKATSAEVYYDGALVKSFAVSDDGGAADLILNAGVGHTAVYGTAAQVKVDWVRIFQPN